MGFSCSEFDGKAEPQRWNRSGFLTTGTGTGLSRSDRTGPVTGRSTGDRRVYRQIGTGPDRPVTGTGSISAEPLHWLRY
jgi:hypothetical protein